MAGAVPSDDGAGPTWDGGWAPRTIERIEGGLVVVLAMTGTIVTAPSLWWFPLAAFLAFDLSLLGYLRSPATGAAGYNAVHTYAWPTGLAGIALVAGPSAPTLSTWLALVALAWGLHVGVDRMLGYGLELPDAFAHTHLGWIGKDRAERGDEGRPARTQVPPPARRSAAGSS